MDELPAKAENSRATPEMREAVRSQIVARSLTRRIAITEALDMYQTLVVRMLRRFDAVGVLRLAESGLNLTEVTVERVSITPPFRDLARPLWR